MKNNTKLKEAVDHLIDLNFDFIRDHGGYSCTDPDSIDDNLDLFVANNIIRRELFEQDLPSRVEDSGGNAVKTRMSFKDAMQHTLDTAKDNFEYMNEECMDANGEYDISHEDFDNHTYNAIKILEKELS